MTTYYKIFMAIAAVGLSLFARAATTSVESVAELIAAVSGASDGDEIVVMASGSPYNFASTDGDANGHLSVTTTAKITLRGSTDDPSEVVLVGNANRILYLASKGNSISNLTFRSGNATGRGGAICSANNPDFTTVIQNCVFESCHSTNGGGACGSATASNACFGNYIDCTFSDNSSDASGGAIQSAYTIHGCTFGNNSVASNTSYGGAVGGAMEITGSTFIGNSLSVDGKSASGGGAVYLPANDQYEVATISNCTFTANSVSGASPGGAIRGAHPGLSVVNCEFVGNSTASGYGGAVYDVPFVASCVFSNNCAIVGRGGALALVGLVSGCSIVSNAVTSTSTYGGGVYDCTLSGCYVASNYAYRCGAAADSRLYSCTNEANSASDNYYELGKQSTGCYAEDCTFLNTVCVKTKKIFGTSGFNRCRFLNVGQGYVFAEFVAMTNSLIASSQADDGKSALFYDLKGSASSIVNCTVVSNSYTFAASCTTANMLDIKNCFFYGNKIGGATIDIDSSTSTFVASIKKCILSAADNSYIPNYATSDTLNIYGTAFKPGFVGADDPENPFSLTRRSPAVAKAGLVEDWMAAATDIRGEGFPRLRDGKVDIGCYQCWNILRGLTILFR